MGEPNILHSFDETGTEEECTFTSQELSWFPTCTLDGTETRLSDIMQTIRIPKSKFGAYCKQVLKPLYKYLSEAQIKWKDNRTIVCHGGLTTSKEDKTVQTEPYHNLKLDTDWYRNLGRLGFGLENRENARFLTKIGGSLNINKLLLTEGVSEISGRAPLCLYNTIPNEAFGEIGTSLVIVGHTPTSVGVPVFTKRIIDTEEKWLIQTDTQRTPRKTHNSCVLFNNIGEFFATYTFMYEGKNVKAVINDDYKDTNECLNEERNNKTYKFFKNGIVKSPEELSGKHVLIGCRLDNGYAIPGRTSFIQLSETIANVPECDCEKYTHYTYGDVEGNVTFFRECEALKEELCRQKQLKYVSIGDTVGLPVLKDDAINKDCETSDAKTVAHANTATIKIIGNRDLNKLRWIYEYLRWNEKPYEFKTKRHVLNHTYAVKENNIWQHESEPIHVCTNSIVFNLYDKGIPGKQDNLKPPIGPPIGPPIAPPIDTPIDAPKLFRVDPDKFTHSQIMFEN